MKLLIITGMSGAGKSHAVKFLEDIGYFCVDNMPPSLLPKFAELYLMSEAKLDKIAMVIDVRGGEMLKDIFPILEQFKEVNIKYDVLFLTCKDEVLINRFKENRRLHPLAPDGNILEGINQERIMLDEIRKIATYVVDTSNFTPRDLKKELNELFVLDRKTSGIKINIISFGFKFGLPSVCDLIFDVRFIKNPYYLPELRNLTGNDGAVFDFVLGASETRIFLKKLEDMLEFLLPNYELEGKELLVIGIGCTGGKHRSVAISNQLSKILSEKGYDVSVQHQDIGK